MEKIQELTEKQAKQQASQILAEAREQAQGIEAQAQKKAAELNANTKSELKLYTGQAMSALKSEIANVLTNGVVEKAVADLTDSKDFLGQFAVALASKWAEDEPIVISSSEAESLKSYFAAHAKALLDKGVTIEKVSGKPTLLSISPADGSYKVNFGKEEFETYFKNFLRPQLVEMLF